MVFRWGSWWKRFEEPWVKGYRPYVRYVPVLDVHL